jgi:hypothetical protein
MTRFFLGLCIGGLLIALVFKFTCPPTGTSPTTDTIVMPPIYVYDTTLKIVKVPRPYPQYVTIEAPPPFIDTLAIIESYFSMAIYDRVPVDDSNMYIRIIDTVFMNELYGGVLEYIIRKPLTVHETYHIHKYPDPKWQLHGGLGIGGSKNTFGLGPTLTYQDNQGRLYTGYYDALNQAATFSFSTRIFKKE